MKNLNFETYKNQNQIELSNLRKLFIEIVKPGDSFLDIGGATGTFLHLVNKMVPIKGTVLDCDKDCIEWGIKNRPHITFIEGKVPELKDRIILENFKFDHVSMWALFPHFGNWKTIIKEMVNFSNKSIMFSSILKTSGTTVVDKDVSYFYYFNTGERVHQVIHNVYELLNFLCLQEIRAKRIICVGQSVLDNEMKKELEGKDRIQCSGTLHIFRGMSIFEQYKADWLIGLWPENENPKRMGGAGCGMEGKMEEEYKFYLPDIEVWLDGELFIGAKNNGWIF